MPAITHQKNEEVQEIVRLMTLVYDQATAADKRTLFINLVIGYSGDMTLNGLKDWHEKLTTKVDSESVALHR